MPGVRTATMILALAALPWIALPAEAKDYGQAGAVFPIVEDDFLQVIARRLQALERSGALARLNREMAATVKAQVLDPPPVAGIAQSQKARTWYFDPTIELAEDLRDEEGRIVARRGTTVNPLDHVGLRQRLIFLNGKDASQVRWALTAAPEAAKLILVEGSAFRLMEQHKRRFYFDQAGTLTARFGITHVPAVVEQDGRRLRIREVPVARSAREARP